MIVDEYDESMRFDNSYQGVKRHAMTCLSNSFLSLWQDYVLLFRVCQAHVFLGFIDVTALAFSTHTIRYACDRDAY